MSDDTCAYYMNPKFNDYIDVIYPKELEIKDTTYAPKRANYLDHHLEFDEDSKLFTRLDTDILHENFRLLFGNSMVAIQTLFTNLTHLWGDVSGPLNFHFPQFCTP